MHVAPALDEGDVILQHKLEIQPNHTGGVVHDLLAELAPAALLEGLEKLFAGSAERMVQDDSLANYAPKLLREDGEIDWTRSAVEIERRVRAYDPWPGTTTAFINASGKLAGKVSRLKIFPPIVVESEMRGEPGEVLEVSKLGVVIACGSGGDGGDGGAVRVMQLQPEGSARMDAGQFANGRGLGLKLV